jgi:phenylacetate-coenzyme A ligase PaaK-like adenylate-forming protein
MNHEIAPLVYIKNLIQFSIKQRREIEMIVMRNLKQVLADAAADCDFYKDKVPPFPFLTKEDVRNNIHTGMISNRYIGDPRLIVEKTSGSADEAVSFAYLQGFHRYARMVFPFLVNTNWRWGDRFCLLTTLHCSRDRCSTQGLPSYVNQVKIPTSDHIFTDQEVLGRVSTLLKDNQGAIIHADPFYLCAAASYLEATGVQLSFKGISSTYELLTPYVKRYLEKIFTCKVFDNYGCSEFGPIAFACGHESKHIFENAVFVEIVDRGRYMDEEVGEIVVTSLDNPAMPLIRYRTGDLGKWIIGPCGCKRTAKRMEIMGRMAQCVSLKGIWYTEKDFAQLMDVPGVLLYQLVQGKDSLAFNIFLEKGHKDRQDKIRCEIKDRFAGLTQKAVSVIFVEHLSPAHSGKFKTVFSV